VGSVDLSESTTAAIHAGTCDFTIDQQQYLQGYLPIVLFELEREFLLAPTSSQTGPFFVDSSNVDAIERLVNEGYR
jgi:simple sugar transport system substrate-binding protein